MIHPYDSVVEVVLPMMLPPLSTASTSRRPMIGLDSCVLLNMNPDALSATVTLKSRKARRREPCGSKNVQEVSSTTAGPRIVPRGTIPSPFGGPVWQLSNCAGWISALPVGSPTGPGPSPAHSSCGRNWKTAVTCASRVRCTVQVGFRAGAEAALPRAEEGVRSGRRGEHHVAAVGEVRAARRRAGDPGRIRGHGPDRAVRSVDVDAERVRRTASIRAASTVGSAACIGVVTAARSRTASCIGSSATARRAGIAARHP